MGLHKLSAGDGYTYLTRQVAAADDTNRGYGSLGAYYEEKGESPGVWVGAGLGSVPDFSPDRPVTEAQMVALFGEGRHPDANAIERRLIHERVRGRALDRATQLGQKFPTHEADNEFRDRLAARYRVHNERRGKPSGDPIAPAVRSRIRTKLAREMFAERHGRAPIDARELSGFLARASRQAPAAVAGYDLTFSPVKSVSTLWAIAHREVSEQIATCHQEAVADTLGWLERHACYTRRGAGGVAQVETTGFVAAAFTHRDSRAGDPDLHTHVAVSNKVCTRDGTWLSLDGRALYKNKVAASERYNARLEALVAERLGVRFADRGVAADGRRPVREIVGIDGVLPHAWSARRTAIEDELAALRRQFQADHGRPPTAVETQKLAQQATLSTRDPKHEPRSLAEQRAGWRAEAISVLGDDDALHGYVQRALHPRPEVVAASPDVEHVARVVVEALQSRRATWQVNHVRAEAERCARGVAVPHSRLDDFVEEVVDRVLSPAVSVGLTPATSMAEPAVLRRSDGTSVYEIAGSRRYTSAAILAAEQSVLTYAGRRDGRRIDEATVAVSLLEQAANGTRLGSDQAAMVRELATSGARVQLALAPAGTGKTVTMRALAHAWTTSGGNVVGLAPSAAAAAVLRDELGEQAVAADTLAKLVHAAGTGTAVPDWVPAIGPDTLLVIDEAGMAGTLDLAAALEFAVSRGASVRLIGDDQQLAAVGAGGVLRDVQRSHGAATISTVRRFVRPDGSINHGEAAASLAVRDGDPAGLAYYTDHGRIHVGDVTTTADQAYAAWARDRAAGLDAVLLGSTRDVVRELNLRARTDRLAQHGSLGSEVLLAGGTHASPGDVIITRRNDRRLTTSATDWVANGDRWTITAVRLDGSVDVSHTSGRRRAHLPADYVRDHVELGYASTVHGAQGLTADAAHLVVTGGETRQLLYVGLSRGRHANNAYVDIRASAELHAVTDPDAIRSQTAVETLAHIVERDDAPASATSEVTAAREPAVLLRRAAAEYVDALGVAAESVIGAANLARLDAQVEQMLPGVTDCPAWPTLRTRLECAGLDGTDPYDVLERATRIAPLTGAEDPAAVLAWRLDATHRRHGALPWLPPVPASLAEDPQWGNYFTRRHELINDQQALVAGQTTIWTTADAPDWARPFLARDATVLADLAVWRACHEVPDSEPRPTGPPARTAAEQLAQRLLDRRAEDASLPLPATISVWRHLADTIQPELTRDSHWSILARQLDRAHVAGIDVAAMLRESIAERPLPDEQPAAALTWRIVDVIGQHQRTLRVTGAIDAPPPARTAPTAPRRASRIEETAAKPAQPKIDYQRAPGGAPSHGPGARR